MQPLAHSRSHIPPRPQTFPQSPEALDAVLGRFQEWTASRKVVGDHGLREVSYEDAVYANRRGQRPAPPSTDTKSARLKSEPGAIPVESPVTAKPVKIQPTPIQTIADQNPKARASKPRRKTAQQAASTKSGAKSNVKRGAESIAAKPAPQPSFKTVLAETIAPPSSTVALTHSRQLEAERPVTLSLRMAPSEQALIRARASAAGVSTSVYLRQCALEVEQLREQMRQTLALIGQSAAFAVSNQTQQMQPSMQAPQPGFLERLKQIFFAGRQSRNLSLRA